MRIDVIRRGLTAHPHPHCYPHCHTHTPTHPPFPTLRSREGHLTALMRALCDILKSLHVQRLVVPAAKKVYAMWEQKFKFQRATPRQAKILGEMVVHPEGTLLLTLPLVGDEEGEGGRVRGRGAASGVVGGAASGGVSEGVNGATVGRVAAGAMVGGDGNGGSAGVVHGNSGDNSAAMGALRSGWLSPALAPVTGDEVAEATWRVLLMLVEGRGGGDGGGGGDMGQGTGVAVGGGRCGNAWVAGGGVAVGEGRGAESCACGAQCSAGHEANTSTTPCSADGAGKATAGMATECTMPRCSAGMAAAGVATDITTPLSIAGIAPGATVTVRGAAVAVAAVTQGLAWGRSAVAALPRVLLGRPSIWGGVPGEMGGVMAVMGGHVSGIDDQTRHICSSKHIRELRPCSSKCKHIRTPMVEPLPHPPHPQTLHRPSCRPCRAYQQLKMHATTLSMPITTTTSTTLLSHSASHPMVPVSLAWRRQGCCMRWVWMGWQTWHCVDWCGEPMCGR